MKLAWGLLTITLAAQECRLTPLSPTQPPLKVDEGERATESQTFQTAIFAGEPAEVTFAGGATGQIGGLYQVTSASPKAFCLGRRRWSCAWPIRIRMR